MVLLAAAFSLSDIGRASSSATAAAAASCLRRTAALAAALPAPPRLDQLPELLQP